MPDLLQSAETELAEIDRKLAELVPLQARREQLRSFLSLANSLFSVTVKQPAPEPQYVPFTFAAHVSSQKERIAVAAAEVIATSGPMGSRRMVQLIEAKGVIIGGADKVGSLSAVLSRDDRFKSNRAAGGWVLVQSRKEETPTGAPTPVGA
jgi:hypothetical protein